MPLQITFRNTEPSQAIEADIKKRAAKLDRIYNLILRCRVMVEAPSPNKPQGGLYHTSVELTLPGSRLIVNRNPDMHHSYTDVHLSIRDAFLSTERQLEEYAWRFKCHLKTHEPVPTGWVESLFPDKNYGRISTSDGKDIYFHRNSLLNDDFDMLTQGMRVRFIEQQGDNGPQASSVRLMGKQREL